MTIQEFEVLSNNHLNLTFHMEEIMNVNFECKMIKFLRNGQQHDLYDLPFSVGQTAKECFENMLNKINTTVFPQQSPGDSINSLDNPCNDVFLNVSDQNSILQAMQLNSVILKKNGICFP